jgi:polyisoprenoid-binding protein YceI
MLADPTRPCHLSRRDFCAHACQTASAIALGSFVAIASTAPNAQGLAGAWQAADGDIAVLCPLTVGGSFEARTTAITGRLAIDQSQPGALSGELQVDLQTLDTGISLRNTHLREKYLEVGKGSGFDRAVLSEIVVDGADLAAGSGKGTFTGVLALHGTRKPVSGEVRLTPAGGYVKVDATFPVQLADFGIPEPRYLGVGVRDQVKVRARFVARADTAGSTR